MIVAVIPVLLKLSSNTNSKTAGNSSSHSASSSSDNSCKDDCSRFKRTAVVALADVLSAIVTLQVA
jgi:hypothetical protein